MSCGTHLFSISYGIDLGVFTFNTYYTAIKMVFWPVVCNSLQQSAAIFIYFDLIFLKDELLILMQFDSSLIIALILHGCLLCLVA